MVADALDSDYEAGVADVLSYLAGNSATVQRNVRLPGIKSGKRRQVDVYVTGELFGYRNATMIVDCKRYAKSIDVTHVGAFVSLVEDVGADVGLLVSTQGISPAAQAYADSVRGIRLDILPLDQLAAWSPPGTIHFDFAVPSEKYGDAVRVIRRSGFRVRPIEVDEWRGDVGRGFSAFFHSGDASPTGERQAEAREKIVAALNRVGIPAPVALANGVVVNGGTPGHRWLEVCVDGTPTGTRVLVSSDEEITAELDWLASYLPNASRSGMDVIRPSTWPVPKIFPH